MIVVWCLLFFNVMPSFALPTVIPFPQGVGQLMTQGSLFLALALAVALNPQLRVRPNAYLLLLTFLAIVAVMVAPHNEFVLGSTYRAVRFIVLVAVLWLLTPAWGRADKLLLKAHVVALTAAVSSVVLGLILSPGKATAYGGRLSGAIWPMPPTQVAHYAAVLLGIAVVFWLTGRLATRLMIVVAVVLAAVLLLTHTRTALLALALGLALAVASLFLGHARVRRVSLLTLGLGIGGALVFSPLLGSWLLRGQSAEEVTRLTGRTVVWSEVIGLRRGLRETLVGSGLSDGSFDGLSIDSSWVTTYLDQGLLGVAVHVLVLALLLVTAAFRPRSPQRAVALFLIVYVLVASFTENALNSPTTYVLDLTVAASLIAPPGRRPGES